MDDALITFRYSINLAEIGSPIWNKADLSNPSMGYTSMLWMLINSLLQFIFKNKDIIIISKILNMILLIPYFYIVSSVLTKQKLHYYSKIIFICLVSFSSTFSFHASSGMETILWATSLSLFAFIYKSDLSNYWVMIFLGFLLFLIRPEGSLAVAYYWTSSLIINRNFKQSIFSGSIILILLLVYFSILFNYYGSIFPNAMYIKQGSFGLKSQAIIDALVFLITTASPYLIISSLLIINKKFSLKEDTFIIIMAGIFFFSI